MKRILVVASAIVFILTGLILNAGDKGKGEKCFADFDCGFNLECKDGVCVKKKDFDFGGSGKSGKPCFSDSDCIGSGKCVEGNFGKKYCSGN